jgi:hypothetical protein
MCVLYALRDAFLCALRDAFLCALRDALRVALRVAFLCALRVTLRVTLRVALRAPPIVWLSVRNTGAVGSTPPGQVVYALYGEREGGCAGAFT